MWLLCLSLLACEAPPTAAPPPALPPAPQLELAAPWRVVDHDELGLTVRLADSADGVRVQLGRDDRARMPGVTPIHQGKTLLVEDGGALWPMIALPFPDRPVQRALVLVQGVDLVVRIEGPPLSDVTDDPEADERPIVTMVRVRRRPSDWRIVVDGVATHNLPGGDLRVVAARRGFRAHSAWGALTVDSAAPSAQSRLDGRWSWSTVPSIEDRQPYPRTGMTWRP